MSQAEIKDTILIIDDDRVLCGSIKDYLSSDTVQVLTANTGTEGVNICSERKVDVLLLDQNLPDGNGHSFCPSILSRNDMTKIIFITAYPSFDYAVKAIKAGAHD